MKERHVSLVGHITKSEVVQRRWIATIVGTTIGTTPRDIKKEIFAITMDLAPKIPGAQTVTVGLSKTHRGSVANRDKLLQRERQSTYRKRTRGPGRPPTGTFRRVNREKQITEDQAHALYLSANGQLDRNEKIVLSHIMGWGVKKLSKRDISRQFSLGGELNVRKLARSGWQKLGVVKVKRAFEKID